MSPRIGLDLNIIVQTASDIVSKDGIESLTLSTLAKKLNIKSPSLYNQIDGLDDLKKRLAIYGLDKLYASLEPTVMGRSGNEAVLRFAKAYAEFARSFPGLYEATLRAPDPQDEDVQLAGNKLLDLAMGVLGTYDLEEEETLHAVRGLRSILHGFISLEQKGGFGLSLDLDKSFTLLIKTFLAGIHEMKAQ